MYELIHLTPNAGYIDCPSRMGLVKTGDGEVCLIDSGSEKEAGKKALRHIRENGWHLRAIYNTHSHADHIGGNAYLQQQTGCAIYAPGAECDFTNHPFLEPSYVYGGYPCRDLRHKFLLAQPSTAQPLTPEVLPEGFALIPLKGHCFDMTGLRTPEDVVYLADCLSSRETLEKYRIGFLYDVKGYLETLEMVKTMQARIFVPAHAQPAEDIAPLAQHNIDQVLEIADTIRAICREPIGFDDLLQKLFIHYQLTMNFQQHALVGSTVRSYLAWMRDMGEMDVLFENSRMLWHRR